MKNTSSQLENVAVRTEKRFLLVDLLKNEMERYFEVRVEKFDFSLTFIREGVYFHMLFITI